MLSKHIFHFALIHEGFSNSADVYKGLMPLFAPLISNRAGEEFKPATFCEDVKEFYGIVMHPYVAEGLTNRFEKMEYLSRKSVGSAVQYVHNRISDCESVSEVEKKFDELFNDFSLYSEKVLSSAGIEFDGVDFDYEFSRRLARLDIGGDDYGVNDSSQKNTISDALDYIFARFTSDLFSIGSEKSKLLVEAHSGALFAEAVLSIRQPDFDADNFKKKVFYMDAPIILNVLGFNEDYSVRASKEIIRQILDLGGVITTFDYYLTEVRQTISAALENYKMRGSRHTNIDRFIFKNPDRVIEVRAAQTSLNEMLLKAGFNLDYKYICCADNLHSKRAQELKDDLYERIGDYRNDEAKQRDVSTITYFVANQKYTSIRKFKDLNSLFVTNNSRLVDNANEYLYMSRLFERPDISPILNERNLAMLIWVTAGGQVDDLSSLALISNCTKVVQQHQDIFLRVRRFLSDLPKEKAEIYEQIIRDDRAIYSLMDATAGNVELINADNVVDVFEKALDAVRQQAEIATTETLKSKFMSEINDKEEVIESVSSELKLTKKALMEKEEQIAQRDKELASLSDGMLKLNAKLESLLEDNEKKKEAALHIANHKKATIIKILNLFFSLLFAVVAFFAGRLAISSGYGNEYFEIKPALGDLIAGAIAILTSWRLPDILLGGFIERMANRIYVLFNVEDRFINN